MISPEISDQAGNGDHSALEQTRDQEPAGGQQTLGPVTVAHVPDFHNRYFGETITFYTRLEVHESLSNATLRIALPAWVTIRDYQAVDESDEKLPVTSVTSEENTLIWPLRGTLTAGTRYDYQTVVKIPQPVDRYINELMHDTTLESRAYLIKRGQGTLAEETTTIAVKAKGDYLKHLPALYERDKFMSRFLMLFESFWAPIEGQIDTMFYYLDPRITPQQLLPWLASWLDLNLDERWAESKQRQLIRWAIALHRSRGTKWGLLKYLEIYTGQKATIVEYRSKNFVLGPDARLGPSIALGRRNMPHTFAVYLRLPAIEARLKKERSRLEAVRRRTIESIIEMQKPAHTLYTLELEIVSSDEWEAQAETIDTQPTEEPERTDEIAALADIWFKLDDER